MVSLWPWKKGEDNSPASFEKALAALSTNINQSNASLDTHRQHARRFKALWTLYTTFAYLLYSIILALVLGWQNWGVVEYAAVAGGPILIYVVRTGASRFFDYRIAKTQRHLNDLEKQREETIEKLKVATKYNSTQQLLDKYGGESPKPSPSKGDEEKRMTETKRKPSTPQQPVARTGLAPPPTANIRRGPFPNAPASPPAPSTPSSPNNLPPPSPYGIQTTPPPSPQPPTDEPGFAPNAFPSSSQYVEHSHWYDRLLDVLLGEDETQPKNRIALICRACRLVNGQTPPGVRTLEELGRWRCGGCGAWNGEESETTKVLADIRGQSKSQTQSANADSAWEPVSKTEVDNHSSVGDATDEAVMVAASDDSSAAETPDDIDEEEPAESESNKPSTRQRSKGGVGKEKR